MSRASGRSSRGLGTGCVPRRTEAGRGGAGPEDFDCLRMFFLSSVIGIFGIYCLVWELGQSHVSHPACHNHAVPSASSLSSHLPHG